MSLRLVIVRYIAGSTSKMLDGTICRMKVNSYGWSPLQNTNVSLGSDVNFDRLFQSGSDMLNRKPHASPSINDMLNGEARAVIDAEFEEIAKTRPNQSLKKSIQGGLLWIWQKLQHVCSRLQS